MAAKDYEIVTGWMNAYLVKKKKPTNKGTQTMSEDRRLITKDEMLGLFEFYLRKWCEGHEGENTMFIIDDDGKLIFKATLLDKEVEPKELIDTVC